MQLGALIDKQSRDQLEPAPMRALSFPCKLRPRPFFCMNGASSHFARMSLGSKFMMDGPREQMHIRLFKVATPSLFRR